MKHAASQYGIVDLNNVRQNNIVYVDLGKSLQESNFERQHKMASEIIASIIRESDRALNPKSNYCRECPRSSCDACIYRDSQGFRSINDVYRNLTHFHTAVPFIGERGTGKTSVMYSVLERLRNYNGNNAEAAFYLGSDYNQVHFVTLDMIDAGMLKTTDDVLEIILAQMLGYLESLRKDNDFLDLYRQIDELHKDLCSVHEQEFRNREEYGLTSLQLVENSREAVKNFQQLVQEFLATMSKHRFDCRKCYLVVALDDIDMYQGSNWGMRNTQFALLEHIYCHLRIPGLIVLMTFNEHLLKRACNRHFEEIYFGCRVNRPYTSTEQMDIDALTAQFMSKLFPQEKRIYMPNYMLVDALDRPNLYVRPDLDGKRINPFGKDEDSLAVKEFMLRLIAHKTDVFFDAAGTKKHFFEPRNLRELGELFQFVDSMENIPPEKDQQDAVKARNRQRLLDYLKNQYALRHLDAKEYEEFAKLLALPLWRQDRTLIDKIRLQRRKIAKTLGEFGYLAGPSEDRWRYSYGELLHNIYFSTRISKEPGGSDSYFRKEFMHCILGTHSVQMNEAVRSMQPRQDMLKVVGSSLAGRWANKMLPVLLLPDISDAAGAGSISLPVRSFFDWQIPETVQWALLSLDREDNDAQKEYLTDFIEALVVAGMFFTNIPSRGLGIQLDVDSGEDGTAVLCLRSESNEHICFNVLNFAINLYDALPEEQDQTGGYLPRMEKKLIKLGDDFSAKLRFDWRKAYQDAEKTINKLTSEDRRSKLRFAPPDIRDRDSRQLGEARGNMERAALWQEIQEMNKDNLDAMYFRRTWNMVVRKVISKYRTSIIRWREDHGRDQWVLPVQNFDMMYNINKRLANVSYHDIADDANASEVFSHYVSLYQSLAEELEKQDAIYFADRSGGFSKAFRDCAFYSAITATRLSNSGKLNKSYNPLIEKILVSIVSSTIRMQAVRKRVADISL